MFDLFVFKVKGVLMDSKLPLDTLGKIWDLADQDKDGMLDRHEFIAVSKNFRTILKLRCSHFVIHVFTIRYYGLICMYVCRFFQSLLSIFIESIWNDKNKHSL